ncbi:hypothetical protein Cva_01643 [Caedimonas varicaedens]|uniref:Uncharacterized protein n=1 Tax=Caedimonas varicaedens TaxID=1629334 RepID=A0A0K8MFK3_9PROT|nr:hypothetical protein Cva_01643 [Caedimonas varicaedens]
MTTAQDRALQMLRSQNASVEAIAYVTGLPSKDIFRMKLKQDFLRNLKPEERLPVVQELLAELKQGKSLERYVDPIDISEQYVDF